jgi:hypothetical protein
MTHNIPTTAAALLGDVIASRDNSNRASLQQSLVETMKVVNVSLPTLQPLSMTVGDEFQGLFSDLAAAFAATLRLQLQLAPRTDVRFGIGWGELTLVPSEPPFGQDGPCWWRARDAIEEVKSGESSNLVARSTRVRCHTGTDLDALLNGYLAARDHIVVGLDSIDRRLGLMRIAGATQAEMADAVSLSQSSVSRRFQSHGLFALIDNQPDLIDMSGS